MVEINHSGLSNEASISIKIFINDMEDALRNELKENIELTNVSSCAQSRSEVNAYFKNHFSLLINDKEINAQLEKCEINGDAIWFRFRIPCPSKWTSVQVKADFLMELFPTQSNVVSIENEGKKQFMNLTKAIPSGVVKF